LNRSERISIFASTLQELGYNPKIDEEGDIVFVVPETETHPKMTLNLITEEGDEEFAFLGYYYFWSIDSHSELQLALGVASIVNERYKCVKIYAPKFQNITASVEMRGTAQQIADSLGVSVKTLVIGATDFATTMVKGGLVLGSIPNDLIN
jgi:hypothetical protein